MHSKMNLEKPLKFLSWENSRPLINRPVMVVLYWKAKEFDCGLQFEALERRWPRYSIPKTTHRQMSFKVKGQVLILFDNLSKVGCVFLMVIVSILAYAAWAMQNSDQMTIGKTHPTLFKSWTNFIWKTICQKSFSHRKS